MTFEEKQISICGVKPIAPRVVVLRTRGNTNHAEYNTYLEDVTKYERALASWNLCANDVKLIVTVNESADKITHTVDEKIETGIGKVKTTSNRNELVIIGIIVAVIISLILYFGLRK